MSESNKSGHEGTAGVTVAVPVVCVSEISLQMQAAKLMNELKSTRSSISLINYWPIRDSTQHQAKAKML